MHHFLVHRATQGIRKSVHAKEGWFDPEIGAPFACQFLKDHGFDTRFDRLGQILEDPGHDAAGFPHGGKFKIVFQINAANLFQRYCLPLILPFCMRPSY